MKTAFRFGFALAVASASCTLGFSAPAYLSAAALAPSRDGRTLYVGCATANEVAVFDTTTRHIVRRIAPP